jgi:glucosamine-phosphate N-acetyltransferase
MNLPDITLTDITKLTNTHNKNIISILNELSNTCNPYNDSQFETLKLYLNDTPTHKIWLISENGEHIGIITTILEPKIIHHFGYVLHIEDFVIREKFRGSGIGKYVLHKIKEYAQSVHAYKIILNCSQENIRFYEKSGFTQKNVEMSMYL